MDRHPQLVLSSHSFLLKEFIVELSFLFPTVSLDSSCYWQAKLKELLPYELLSFILFVPPRQEYQCYSTKSSSLWTSFHSFSLQDCLKHIEDVYKCSLEFETTLETQKTQPVIPNDDLFHQDVWTPHAARERSFWPWLGAATITHLWSQRKLMRADYDDWFEIPRFNQMRLF